MIRFWKIMYRQTAINVNLGNNKTTSGSTEFEMNFPVNDPNNIKILELKDMSTMDHEIQQASEGFVTAVGQSTAFTEAQPLQYNTEEELLELENQPAYMRRQQAQAPQPEAAKPQTAPMSHMTLSSDGKLRENNSFLFDNVD